MAMPINPIDQARDEALAQRGLPEIAYVDNKDQQFIGGAPLIAIKRGEQGFHPIHSRLSADQLNELNSVTPAQREAMLCGSMFGWHLKGADPAFHQPLLDRKADKDVKKGAAE